MKDRVAAVIVTFNRLDKLKTTLSYYQKQELLPKYIIIVNNASSDGTKEFLEAWSKEEHGMTVIVKHLPDNVGGSGGFYEGEKIALDLDVDWVMIADDDAYPKADYISGLVKYADEHDLGNSSIICGSVYQSNTLVNEHRRYFKTYWRRHFYVGITQKDIEKEVFYPDFASYVGILINKSILQEVGLVDKDFFIWNDDMEHTLRLSKVGKIICVPQYTIVHDAADDHYGFSWKDYYGIRNSLVIFKRYYKIQYPVVLIGTIIKGLLCPLKGSSFKEMKLRFAAISDAINNKMGKHTVYRPGWK